MYYAHFILNKKGPLSKIWLAAHWDKKLTKAQIYETNIESTIETILEPQMKLALRTSGHLLLGVCRIYSRKVKYLLADCNEAFVKIKLAFRPGLIDLPKEKQQANADAITLPEKFPDLTVNLMADFSMMDKMNDLSAFGGVGGKGGISQQARVEDITLKEDFGLMGANGGSSALIAMQDDDFGDMGAFDMDSFMFGGMEKGRRALDAGESGANGHDDMTMEFMDDNLGTSGIVEKDKSKRSEMSGVDIDQMEIDPKELTIGTLENAPLGDDTMINEHDENDQITHLAGQTGIVPTLFDDQPTVNNTNSEEPANKKTKTGEIDMILEEGETASILNDENKAPQAEKRIRNRKQRKLIIDDIKEIESGTMKAQLSDTRAILGTLELAPPTRRLMQLKESGSVDKLFSGTAKPVKSKLLQKMFVRTAATHRLHEEPAAATRGHRDSTRHDGEIEAQMQNEHSHLPLAELGSFADMGQKTLNGSMPHELSNRFDDPNHDDFVGGGGGDDPSAMTFTSMGDLVEPQVNLERTPGKDDHKKRHTEDTSDEEGDDKTKKSPKTKSPKRKSITKRSFRESQIIEDMDETVVDDAAATNDPNKLLTKRARTMVSLLHKSLTKYDNVSFFDMSRQNARKTTVQKFYSLLVLTKLEIIEVSQDEMYGDIIVSKGDKFDTFNQSQQLSQ